MVEILTSAQMRAVECAAIDSGAATGLELMECAGRNAAAAMLEHWGLDDESTGTALILCGPGNNGGDGFVVARVLAARGWAVTVGLWGDAAKLPPDARENHDRWAQTGIVHPLSPDLLATAGPDTFVIDALFGTGLTRPLSGGLAGMVGQLQGMSPRGCIALDAPSGLCLDSGRVLGAVFPADLTITFHRAKIGHYLGQGPECCGRLAVVDIGLQSTAPTVGGGAVLLDQSVARDVNKTAARHKYSYGHALVLAGGVGKGGAARLAARAALRIGAGVVTLGCPPAALQENACRLDAVMLRAMRGPDDLTRALADARVNALCVGPGGGLDARAAAMLRAALEARRPTVLDADALTLLAQGAVTFGALRQDMVLTPHAGEFARVFPDIAARLHDALARGPAYSKRDATCDAAARAGCVVVFKGPDTTIATPDGRCAINAACYDQAAPWLATAGAGDVLAGMIAGLLARGFPAFDAACAGTWLHSQTARHFGPGLIAEDLPDTLPRTLRALG